jgi:hypothetical protein
MVAIVATFLTASFLVNGRIGAVKLEKKGTRDYAGRVHVLGIGAKTGPEC